MSDFGRSIGNAVHAMVAAGLISTLLIQYVDWEGRRQAELRDTRYLFVKIAFDLEDFAEKCAELAADYDALSPRRRTLRAWHLPAFATWQSDDRARLLPNDLVSRLWAIRLKKRYADEYIASAEHYAPDEVAEATRDEAIMLSASAWSLARQMRSEQGFRSVRIADNITAETADALSGLLQKSKANGGPLMFPD